MTRIATGSITISNLPLAALPQLTCSRATTVSYKRAVPIEANRRDNFAVTPKIMRVLAVAAWVAAGNGMPAWVHAEPVAAAPSTAKLEHLSEFFENEVTTGKLAGATSLRAIAAGLNEQGIPTARGTGKWSAVQVARVLERL